MKASSENGKFDSLPGIFLMVSVCVVVILIWIIHSYNLRVHPAYTCVVVVSGEIKYDGENDYIEAYYIVNGNVYNTQDLDYDKARLKGPAFWIKYDATNPSNAEIDYNHSCDTDMDHIRKEHIVLQPNLTEEENASIIN